MTPVLFEFAPFEFAPPRTTVNLPQESGRPGR